VGHGQIRQNMGLINQDRWLERLSPWLSGMHVHDVLPPAMDHVMPPLGQVDFTRLKKYAETDIVLVIEPSTKTAKEDIEAGLDFLKKSWTGNGQ